MWLNIGFYFEKLGEQGAVLQINKFCLLLLLLLKTSNVNFAGLTSFYGPSKTKEEKIGRKKLDPIMFCGKSKVKVTKKILVIIIYFSKVQYFFRFRSITEC